MEKKRATRGGEANCLTFFETLGWKFGPNAKAENYVRLIFFLSFQDFGVQRRQASDNGNNGFGSRYDRYFGNDQQNSYSVDEASQQQQQHKSNFNSITGQPCGNNCVNGAGCGNCCTPRCLAEKGTRVSPTKY